jgi:4-hydroxy-3-polyprenylbenzoate decarboxylase
MGGIIVPSQHIGQIYQKGEARNIPMEFAVALGDDPLIPIAGCSNIQAGVSEADVVGGLREEPIKLVKCETVDLYVPANSEVVIEGEVPPHERKKEGPFGEYTGYRAGERSPKPVLHVKAITYRNDPILPVSCMGVPVDEGAAVVPLTNAAEILNELREKGLPVRMVYCPPEGVSHMAIISTKVPYPNFAKKIAHCVWATKPGTYIPYVIVVDDDVDVTNMQEVIHALCVKCHPYRGIYKFKDSPIYPVMIPFLSPENRLGGSGGGYVLFDCTWPKDWPPESIPKKVSFDTLWPEAIQKKVLTRWKDYGYE